MNTNRTKLRTRAVAIAAGTLIVALPTRGRPRPALSTGAIHAPQPTPSRSATPSAYRSDRAPPDPR